MDSDIELAFADRVGRHFARRYSLPHMTGRVIGWLMLCDPPQQTVAELGGALRASRTAVSDAVSTLEVWSWVQRTRAAGERVDRVTLHPEVWLRTMDTAEFVDLGALARQGLEALEDAPPTRRARLLEMAAFADFLVERMPSLGMEWRVQREALRASGEFPDDPGDVQI